MFFNIQHISNCVIIHNDVFCLTVEKFKQPMKNVFVTVSYLTFGCFRYQITVFPSPAIVTLKSSLSGMTAVLLHINFSVSWIMKKSFRNHKRGDETRTPHCILAVHQYEREVWMYCISEQHKGLCKARIMPSERRGRDRRAGALTEL